MAEAHESISHFYTEDHERLDVLWTQFRRLKQSEPPSAVKILQQFRSGLEQHMAWEESILFSEYDARFGDTDTTTTEELLSDHGEILNILDVIEEKIAANDWAIEREEARLMRTLKAHNENEEAGLYKKLDQAVLEPERAEIFAKMDQGAWDK
jgi:regulator of cell morphogenesis and NO signaling